MNWMTCCSKSSRAASVAIRSFVASDRSSSTKYAVFSALTFRRDRDKMTGMVLEGEGLRAYRAVEALELIATPGSNISSWALVFRKARISFKKRP